MAGIGAAELGSLIEELPELDFGDWLEAPSSAITPAKESPPRNSSPQV